MEGETDHLLFVTAGYSDDLNIRFRQGGHWDIIKDRIFTKDYCLCIFFARAEFL
jgi:hypothetical protein